jgi:uroporphyrinogen III methyltransferase/synthase
MTVRGRDVLRRADVVVYDRLVNPALLDEAPLAEHVFVGKEADHHTRPQVEINEVLVLHARLGRRVVRLKGGDPFVFGRGGEEAEALVAAGIPFEIVPGVTSSVAVPAYAGIPVTHRRMASSFAVVTGHEEDGKAATSIHWEHLATGVDTLVILMGLKALPGIVRALTAHGRSPETPVALIRWGTTESQAVVTGRLSDIVERARVARLQAPVVIVVGDVVRLREHLRWFDADPHQAAADEALLEAFGRGPWPGEPVASRRT